MHVSKFLYITFIASLKTLWVAGSIYCPNPAVAVSGSCNIKMEMGSDGLTLQPAQGCTEADNILRQARCRGEIFMKLLQTPKLQSFPTLIQHPFPPFLVMTHILLELHSGEMEAASAAEKTGSCSSHLPIFL